jgi:pSer/pThr/pTyr-binding forkhead associated (FHA) protein
MSIPLCTSDQPARLVGLGMAQPIFDLEADIYMLGRSSLCQIVLSYPIVSRLHAKIERIGNDYHLYDLGSANGTFVNGRHLCKPHLLTHGDQIGLGSATAFLRFEEARLIVRKESNTDISDHKDR